MKKFNTADLFTGYLKQLLHDFNLPKIKVYTKKHATYYNKHKEESREILSTSHITDINVRHFPYLKDGQIQEYIDNKWYNINTKVKAAPKFYTYGQKILNYTKNLKINSNVYDSYTHEYLGDYLRFQRDYYGLNLMSLYNCFSNRACDKLNLKWYLDSKEVTFNTNDANYKIYMLPVKLFQTYTIAIDSSQPIELCCGIYGDYQDSREKFNNIPKYTYKKISHSIFSQPFIFDLLDYNNNNEKLNTLVESLNENEKIELAQNECDLKLFIKVPINNTSTIVVLEGNYIGWNDRSETWVERNNKKYFEVNSNKSVLNLDFINNDTEINLISPLQLLQFNTNEQHPFADRLIEYLIGNAITNTDEEIYDNVRRAQKALYDNNYDSNGNNKHNYRIKVPGAWDYEMNKLFYEYMTSRNLDFETDHDLLGYVDKDVEKYYNSRTKDKSKVSYVSLSNIELEEGDK